MNKLSTEGLDRQLPLKKGQKRGRILNYLLSTKRLGRQLPLKKKLEIFTYRATGSHFCAFWASAQGPIELNRPGVEAKKREHV